MRRGTKARGEISSLSSLSSQSGNHVASGLVPNVGAEEVPGDTLGSSLPAADRRKEADAIVLGESRGEVAFRLPVDDREMDVFGGNPDSFEEVAERRIRFKIDRAWLAGPRSGDVLDQRGVKPHLDPHVSAPVPVFGSKYHL